MEDIRIQDEIQVEAEDTTIVEQIDTENEDGVNYRGIRAMPFIIGNETCEKLGALGLQAGLQLYLTNVFYMTKINATALLNIFNGTSNFATLPGAYLSDTYFGRYNTLAFGSISSLFGFLVVALTAVFKKLHPPHCGPQDAPCVGPTPWQMTLLLAGFGLLIPGAGAIRSCNLAFGVDQFNPNTPSGKRGTHSFFNWYFITITFAQLISLTVVAYVQLDISWAIGLGIPAFSMLISCVLFFYGTKMYVIVRPEGNPLRSICQVVVVAAKKRQLNPPQQPWLSLFTYIPPNSNNSQLPYTNQFRFLDKAAIVTADDEINPDGSASNPWKLCSMQQVEEVKCILRVIPIWTTTILYHVGQSQQYLVYQASQSNRHLGTTTFQIPPSAFNVFSILTQTLWLPVYDRLLVPFLRRHTENPTGITMLQRIGVGVFLTIIVPLVSAFVEQRRRSLGSSMSGMWLIPQQIVAGLGEAFSGVGQVEFFYKQFPENMRSIAGSVFFLGLAVANYLNSLLITVVHRTTENTMAGNWLPEDMNKGKLDYFYFFITGLCAFNFCYFVICAKWYRYKVV